MSSKVSKPGAFDTSPARAANRRSNSWTRSAGTVMALMRTTLMLLLSPGRAPASRWRSAPAAAACLSTVWTGRARPPPQEPGRRKWLMEGSGRTARFVVYSPRGRGNIRCATPSGKREDRGAPGPLAREPSLVSRRAVPSPVRRLAFFCARFRWRRRRGCSAPRPSSTLLAQEPLDLRRQLVAGRDLTRVLVRFDVADHLRDVG